MQRRLVVTLTEVSSFPSHPHESGFTREVCDDDDDDDDMT